MHRRRGQGNNLCVPRPPARGRSRGWPGGGGPSLRSAADAEGADGQAPAPRRTRAGRGLRSIRGGGHEAVAAHALVSRRATRAGVMI
jgi:hypothetical protein